MALLKLEIPPGIYHHGTDYEASNRWHNSNLIRWEGLSLRPVGGWVTRVSNATPAAVRGAITWFDNGHDSHIAMGTYEKLYTINPAGTVYDITPTAFNVGTLDSAIDVGYGSGNYGLEPFGVERVSNNVWEEATSWSLDTWGEYLVACSVDDGNLYEY